MWEVVLLCIVLWEVVMCDFVCFELRVLFEELDECDCFVQVEESANGEDDCVVFDVKGD